MNAGSWPADEWLDVDGGHRLWYRQHGSTGGVPVVAIHGGPGSGTRDDVAAMFDLARYRLITYDQRGAGRSQPAGCVEHNSTAELLDDLERLREQLGLDRWALFAGSWGATLALLYAQRHPRRVLGAVLRGVFLARREDIEWFFGADGVACAHADEHRRLRKDLPDDVSGAALTRHYAGLLQSGDADTERATAARWLRWESLIATGRAPDLDATPTPAQIASARIASHYAANEFFLGPYGVPLDPAALAGIPCRIVHGTRDAVCRPEGATLLQAAWPGASLLLVDGTHVASDPGIAAALREALTGLLAVCA